MTVVHSILESPHPDRRTRIPLPLPYRFGSIGCKASGFFIVYSIASATTVLVHYVGWDNPDYWG